MDFDRLVFYEHKDRLWNVISEDSFKKADWSLALLSLGSSLLSFSGSLLSSSFSLASHIEVKTGVLLADWFDQALLVHILNKGTSNWSSNLELLAKNGSGDAKNLWHLLDHSLVLLLVEENGVVKLFLYLNLGPGLLLCFGSSLGLAFLGIFRGIFTLILCTNLCLFSLKIIKKYMRTRFGACLLVHLPYLNK